MHSGRTSQSLLVSVAVSVTAVSGRGVRHGGRAVSGLRGKVVGAGGLHADGLHGDDGAVGVGDEALGAGGVGGGGRVGHGGGGVGGAGGGVVAGVGGSGHGGGGGEEGKGLR